MTTPSTPPTVFHNTPFITELFVVTYVINVQLILYVQTLYSGATRDKCLRLYGTQIKWCRFSSSDSEVWHSFLREISCFFPAGLVGVGQQPGRAPFLFIKQMIHSVQLSQNGHYVLCRKGWVFNISHTTLVILCPIILSDWWWQFKKASKSMQHNHRYRLVSSCQNL